MHECIYIADDEKNIREVVKTFMESEGYRVSTFENGRKLLNAFLQQPADLVILDIMMPDLDGFETCKRLRETSTVPIIMLTARDSDLDYATGINLGSDDYFTKPFSAIALLMRVKAIFRRIEYEKKAQTSAETSVLSYGDITIEEQNKQVYISRQPIELTPNEYSLLQYLLAHKDRAVSRNELLDQVWGYDSDVETRAADDTVRRLRKKIGTSTIIIDTIWGFGFRLKEREHAGS